MYGIPLFELIGKDNFFENLNSSNLTTMVGFLEVLYTCPCILARAALD